MKLFLSKECALTLVSRMHDHLDEPRSFGGASGSYWAMGSLKLKAHGENSGQQVSVKIKLGSDWIRNQPVVNVCAPFVRRNIDWHVYGDGNVCYVLQNDWENGLSRKFDACVGMEAVLLLATGWCLSAVDSLAVRHLIGWRLGLKEWPKKWADWRHGVEGIQQYEKEASEK